MEKKEIPVYVFNEHNEAFYFWHRARIEGFLPEKVDLFHVDAHDDMAKPSQFSTSIYFHDSSQKNEMEYFERFALSELNIANFIFPAVLSGLVRNVYFIYPKWRKYRPARKRFSVTSAFGEGKVIKYSIKPDADTDPMVAKAYPDLKQFHYSAMEAERLPKNRKVILDIDLDYFACRDSIYNKMSYDLEITQEQFQKKDLFVADRTLPYSGFEFTFMERENRYYAQVARKKGTEHFHLPSEEEIESQIESLLSVLVDKQTRPAVVTISRSCDSGFCPDEYSRFIEPLLLKKLPLLTKGFQ